MYSCSSLAVERPAWLTSSSVLACTDSYRCKSQVLAIRTSRRGECPELLLQPAAPVRRLLAPYPRCAACVGCCMPLCRLRGVFGCCCVCVLCCDAARAMSMHPTAEGGVFLHRIVVVQPGRTGRSGGRRYLEDPTSCEAGSRERRSRAIGQQLLRELSVAVLRGKQRVQRLMGLLAKVPAWQGSSVSPWGRVFDVLGWESGSTLSGAIVPHGLSGACAPYTGRASNGGCGTVNISVGSRQLGPPLLCTQPQHPPYALG